MKKCLLMLFACMLATSAHAQLSLSSTVDLALKNSPRVRSAQADVDKARAVLAETKDAYIPAVSAGAGLGQSYGYSPSPPTLFNFTANSLVFSQPQFSYVRSARAGLEAAMLQLHDAQEAVAEDAAVTFVSLDRNERRAEAIAQQTQFASHLVDIVQERLDAGQDNTIGLTSAKLTGAQVRLALLRSQDDAANDRQHLSLLLGLPLGSVTTESTDFPAMQDADRSPDAGDNPAVAAAFATARARQHTAKGDTHYLYRPQVSLFVQYSLYATFTDSYRTLEKLYSNALGNNDRAFGVQITLPIFDQSRRAKAHESAADAARALHDAEGLRMNVLDTEGRLSHTIDELHAQMEVAQLEQQLAQQQLDVLTVQLSSGMAGMTPKDEQTQRINERNRFIATVDATFQMQQAEINLMRQRGTLIGWLQSSATAPSAPQH